jgi:hypothetical protein
MQDPPALAYSLQQSDEAWIWSVYDEEGVTVAGGADRSRAAAEAAVRRTLLRGKGARELRSFV